MPRSIDASIAAIALVAGAAIVTRDIGDFEAWGSTIINPWTV